MLILVILLIYPGGVRVSYYSPYINPETGYVYKWKLRTMSEPPDEFDNNDYDGDPFKDDLVTDKEPTLTSYVCTYVKLCGRGGLGEPQS